MTPLKFYRELLARGVPDDTAYALAEKFDTDERAESDARYNALLDRLAVDHRAEARRKKDRERKAKRGIPRNSTETVETEEDKRTPPEPPKKNNPSPPLTGGISPQISASLPEKPKPVGVWASEIWSITPRPGRTRSGKPALETALRGAIRKGHDPDRIKAGVGAYYESPDATKNEGQYAQGVHVVINSGRWESFAEEADHPPDDDPDPWRPRLLNWRMNRYWNSDWGPKPGEGGYRGPAEPEARAA